MASGAESAKINARKELPMKNTLYGIEPDDSEIDNAAAALADDYEVSYGVMTMALREFVVYRLDKFMGELREYALRDKDFDRLFVEGAKRGWKRSNP